MSRVYRALEKAEEEKQNKRETLKEERPPMDVVEKAAPLKEEGRVKSPKRRVEGLALPHREETAVLTLPPDSFAAEQFQKLKTQIFHWSPGRLASFSSPARFPRRGKRRSLSTWPWPSPRNYRRRLSLWTETFVNQVSIPEGRGPQRDSIIIS